MGLPQTTPRALGGMTFDGIIKLRVSYARPMLYHLSYLLVSPRTLQDISGSIWKMKSSSPIVQQFNTVKRAFPEETGYQKEYLLQDRHKRSKFKDTPVESCVLLKTGKQYKVHWWQGGGGCIVVYLWSVYLFIGKNAWWILDEQ